METTNPIRKNVKMDRFTEMLLLHFKYNNDLSIIEIFEIFDKEYKYINEMYDSKNYIDKNCYLNDVLGDRLKKKLEKIIKKRPSSEFSKLAFHWIYAINHYITIHSTMKHFL